MRYIPTLVRPLRGSFVMTSGNVMNGPASRGQVVKTGSFVRSGFSMTRSCALPAPTIFGIAFASGAKASAPPILSNDRSAGRPHRGQRPDARRDLVEARSAQRHGHPPRGPKLIGQNGKSRTLDVGKEQRGAARLHDAVRDLADLEPGIDPFRNDVQFAGLAQRFDERFERSECHGAVVMRGAA